jgi:signal transduction histidine kinase
VQVLHAMEQLRAGKAQRVAWEFPCSSPTEERVFLMQVTPLRDAEGATSGFVFCTVDITPSHRSREALINTGLALARPVDLDHVFEEVGHELRRAAAAQSFAVWLSSEDGSAPTLAYAASSDGDVSRLAAQLGGLARRVIRSGVPQVHQGEHGVSVGAPMTAGGVVIGCMSLVAETLITRNEVEEAQRVLTTLAAQTGAALERVRLVQKVAQKQRLEAIGEVATGVAHELRNPLFGISSAAQLVRFRAPDDTVIDRNVSRILKEVDRLNRMVTSLLEFGRPKPIALGPGDPDAVWDEVLDGQRGLLESRQLSVRRNRSDVGGAVLIDPEQLAQVFLNLLMNAADHAPPGSELTLDSRVIPGAGWRFRIVNGGPPIPAAVLPQVFDMFFSTKPGGTGIGLALCQRIIQEHSGQIAIDSSPDAGTTVSIFLPAISTPRERELPAEPAR